MSCASRGRSIDHGETSELDVFQATNVLEATRSAVPQLEIQLQQGRDALCVLLGIPPQPLGRLLGKIMGHSDAAGHDRGGNPGGSAAPAA